MDLYVYYRVQVADAAVFLTKVTEMQDILRREYSIRTALKRRPEEQDGVHMWMEVYLEVAEGFEAKLEQAVASSQLPAMMVGKRYVEHFLDLTLCA
jgi:citrate lyase beta subunit